MVLHVIGGDVGGDGFGDDFSAVFGAVHEDLGREGVMRFFGIIKKK